MRSPASLDHTCRRRWLSWTLASVAVVAVLAAALWLCVWVLPHRWYPPLSNADLTGLSPADQAAHREGRDRLQNDARTTLLQGLAGLLVLVGAGIGAGVTLRQVRIGREQLEQARQQAQRSDERMREQIAVAQEGQITERFTRAVDQLGQSSPDRLGVRLGGSTPWNASRTTPQPTDWPCLRSSLRSSAATPLTTPPARPVPRRCAH